MRASTPRPRPRGGATLLELLLVTALVALLVGMAVPHARSVSARHATQAAARDVALLLSAARQVAATSRSGAAVAFDQPAATVRLLAGGEAVRRIDLASLYGVGLQTSRDSLAYDARGLGFGAANLRIIVSRESSAETLFVSRLGRMRGRRW